MTRLLHLSDIHFGVENQAAVAATANYIAEHPFDLMIVSGDLTQFGAPMEFESAQAFFAALPGPKLIVPGNHDTPYLGLIKRLTEPFETFEASFGPADGLTAAGEGFQVYGANTARGAQVRLNWSKGAISPGQVREARKRLSAAPPGILRVFVCHHPLTEIEGGPMTGRVRGGRRAAAALAAARVDLVLTGHIHVPFAHPLTPDGDGAGAYAVGAGTLSMRERGAVPSFNVIDVDQDTIAVTVMGWNGEALVAQSLWRLPRRRA